MVYEFDYVVGDEWHHSAIFFRYKQDESRLSVVAIGRTEFRVGLRPHPISWL